MRTTAAAAVPGRVAAPLGPQSLTWSLGFPRTGLLYAGRALLLQVSHPVVGAGVRDFSDFTRDPWGRLDRTLGSLITQLFGGERLLAEAERLRRMHRTIKGTGFHGERYSALHPEAWAWVHLSNFDTAIHFNDRLVRPLTLAQKRRLYGEWRDVGLLLGVQAAEIPDRFDEVPAYVEDMVARRLEHTPTCDIVLKSLELQGIEPPSPLFPAPLWRAVKPLGRRVGHDTTVGLLPPRLRQRLGLAWTARDEARLQRTLTGVRLAAKLVPDRALHYPAAYRAMRQARAHQDSA
jgi:uncharacterized protein (DUF2236 family)